MNTITKDADKRVIPRGRHGLYVSLPKRMKLDGRSRFGKAVTQLRKSLISDLGGDPSTQESLIVDRVVFKVLRLCSFESHILKTQGMESERQSREYLAMSNSLRLDLMAIGLERRERDITPLSQRLAALAGQSERKGGDDGEG